ncbi:MAG: hypothetical protein AAF152_17485 [Cyanobacteria bacterium P01_A01_bin.114]
MTVELLIAIVSGIVTLFASFFVAMYQARVESRKLVKQLEQEYSTALFDKRLEAYPVLFELLHNFNAVIEYGTPTRQQLLDFRKHYDSWVSAHAILLTQATAKLIWGYHNYLVNLLEPRTGGSFPAEQWFEIRNIQVLIGKALRAEIGVFDTAAAGLPDFDKPHVKALVEKLRQSSKQVRRRFGV